MNQREEDKNELISEIIPNKSTELQAFFNFIKSIVGIGMIALPFATNTIGWLYSIILGIPILFIGVKANILLLEVADDINQDKLFYPEVAKITLGRSFQIIVQISVIFLQVGLCIAYLIFLTESITVSLRNIDFELQKWIVFCWTLILIIPLSMIRQMHSFHKISKYGLYFGLFAIFIVVVDCGYLISQGHYSFENKMNLKNTFQYVGVALLVCEGVVPSLNIRDSMIDQKKFKKVAIECITIAFILAFFLSFIAVVTYAEEIKAIIVFNLMNPYAQFISILLYSISLLLTYPVQLFPAVQIIEDKYFTTEYQKIDEQEINQQDQVQQKEEDQVREKRKTKEHFFVDDIGIIIFRFITMALIYIIAFWVPHFSHFLNLIGSIFLSGLFFIFPALMHIQRFYTKDTEKPILLYTALLIVGFASLIFGTYESLSAMIQ